MPATAAAANARYDIDGLMRAIGDVPVTTDTQRVRLRSRDYFWYSPVLNKQLHGKSADIVVTPRNEADVIAVAAACAKLRIPLTPRGAGDRQLRAGGAARRRRAARSHRDEEDRVAAPRHDPLRARPEDERARRRDPAERLGAAHASLDQAHGDDRRLRRRRLGRHRLDQLRRPARAGQHPGGARRHAGGNAARDRAAHRRGAEGQPRLRHDRHHHGAGDAARARVPVGRRDRDVRRFRDRDAGRLRGRARRRRGEEADHADDLADPDAFPGAEDALPGRQARHLRDDRGAVAGKLQGDRRHARHDHAGAAARRFSPARSRSTNTPGTTRRCSG